MNFEDTCCHVCWIKFEPQSLVTAYCNWCQRKVHRGYVHTFDGTKSCSTINPVSRAANILRPPPNRLCKDCYEGDM